MYLFSLHHFLDPLHRSNDHRDLMRKHFLEYFVGNPYREGKIQILKHYSHAKYVLEKLNENEGVEMCWKLQLSLSFFGTHWSLCHLSTDVHTSKYVLIFFLTKTKGIIGVWTPVRKIEDNSFGLKLPVCVHLSKLMHWDEA